MNQNCVNPEQYKHSPGVPMALVVSFKTTLHILEVILMFLLIAGDVETNPGPVHKLTPLNLYDELRDLTDPFCFGEKLGIDQLELDKIQHDKPNGRCTVSYVLAVLVKTNFSHRYERTENGSMSIYCQ